MDSNFDSYFDGISPQLQEELDKKKPLLRLKKRNVMKWRIGNNRLKQGGFLILTQACMFTTFLSVTYALFL